MSRPDSRVESAPVALLDEAARWLSDAEANRHELEGFLEESARPRFLTALDDDQRTRWTAVVLETIRAIDHRLEDLVRLRATELGNKSLFENLANFGSGRDAWSYREVEQRTRRLAAAIWSLPRRGERPTVLLWGENLVEVALCDLACLQFDIIIAPVNTSIEQADLEWIVGRLRPDLCLVDSPRRRQLHGRRCTAPTSQR